MSRITLKMLLVLLFLWGMSGCGGATPTEGVCFLAAIMALFGWVFPAEWWGALVGLGSITSVALYLLYLGPWAILPIAIDLFLLWGVFIARWSAAMLRGA